MSLANSEISIHALREEGDFCPCISATLVLLFLSTPSARRATEAQDYPTATDCISIHALREEGDGNSCTGFGDGAISIHALREEGD